MDDPHPTPEKGFHPDPAKKSRARARPGRAAAADPRLTADQLAEGVVLTDRIPDDPLLGRTIGGCYILSLLGRGAMGSVYKGRQLSLDREVAIKTIREGLLNEEQLFVRFRQEARTVSRFTTPHVVQIHEVGLDQGVHFLVMEYASGGNLQSYARRQPGGRLGLDESLRFLAQSVVGLTEAEGLGIVHRDIKPENLLLDHKGRVKITDFGIAKLLDADVSLTLDSAVLGTPLYMSPEQARGEPINHQSDIFALGASFYQLYTGRPPVSGNSALSILHKKMRIERLSPRAALPGVNVPEGFDRIIARMTERDTGRRYASFRDVAADISNVLENKPLAAPSDGAAARPRRRARRKRRLLALTALLLIACGTFAALHVSGLRGGFGLDDLGLGGLGFGGSGAGPTPAAAPPTVPAPAPSVAPAPAPSPAPSPVTTSSELDPAPVPAPPVVIETSRPSAAAVLESIVARADAVAARLEVQPTRALSDEAAALLELLPQGIEGGDAARAALERLAADCAAGLRARAALEAQPDPETVAVEPPFREIAAYRKRIDEATAIPEGSGGALRAWSESQRRDVARRLGARVRDRLRRQADDARDLLRGLGAGATSLDEARAAVDLLSRSRESLRSAAPEIAEEAESGPFGQRRAELAAAVERIDRALARLQAIENEAESLEAALAGVRRADRWTAALDERLRTRGAEAARQLDALGGRDGKAPGAVARAAAALASRFAAIEARRRLWASHGEAMARAVAHLEARRFAAAAALLAEVRGDGLDDPAAVDLAAAADDVVKAFAALGALEIERARERFERAAPALEAAAPAAARHARGAAERAAVLASLTRDMAPVAAGEVATGDSGPTRVAAFFIDRCEATVRDYKRFVETQRDVDDDAEIRRIWGSRETRASFCRVPSYLDGKPFLDEDLPIEEINYHQARALQLSRGKDLPALEEWWLAARGPYQRGEHRWALPSHRDDIHRDAAQPVPVQRGGRARMSQGERTVHHLAGNVAEWVLARPGSRTAWLVGGRYLDDGERHFAGEKRDAMPLEESRRGYGCRGVLRPLDAFADLLPADTAAPAGNAPAPGVPAGGR